MAPLGVAFDLSEHLSGVRAAVWGRFAVAGVIDTGHEAMARRKRLLTRWNVLFAVLLCYNGGARPWAPG